MKADTLKLHYIKLGYIFVTALQTDYYPQFFF